MFKKSVRAAISVLLVCIISSVGVGAAGAAKPTPKKFSDCAALLKTYKSGVAATKKARGKTKATINAAVYKLNKKLDVDANGIVCDSGDVSSSSSGTAGGAAKKFTPKTFEGSGSEIVTLALPAGLVAVATVEFDGADGVTIATFDADETMIDMVVSSYGPYTGTVLLGRGGDAETPYDVVTLDISGDGNWKVKVSAATTAPLFDDEIEGESDAVYRYNGKDTELSVVHEGEDAFVVRVYDKDGFLVERTVDEYGEIDDVYAMTAGAYIVVTAMGPWSISKA